ncbi:radical SAM family heme chaperone HemW [Candidatus Neptunochlamydia vexilliferae]|uniref:radical SAM family heme chaperone HemW n=1 Tax=Candidatus Neptunichlamydia vexilliferae TaxID=1651774 RepID=UPI001891ADCC|nr:radical SAM family heme chaperone HemW [Candidatus Neptunochlamydia vexilliferae]
MKTQTLTPGSLYLHFPFCTRKCPYCHFYVIPNRDQTPFLEALQMEWELRRPQIEGRELVSIYFGGGTPTLCVKGIEQALAQVSAPEVTVETNPEDVTPELMNHLYSLGVNRVSIGVQSLNNPLLKHLGRNHTAQKAIDAVQITKEAGIDNITIDLMYELPHQTLETWKETVDRAVKLPIIHLSLYNLTIEPHTVFHKRKEKLLPHLPDEETAAAMLAYACDRFEEVGLHRYEISAFGKLSVHNTGYWTGREFLGLGPSAFSYWGGKRFQNSCSLSKYIQALQTGKLPVDFEEKLPPLASLHEKIAVGLRMTEGIALLDIPSSTEALLTALAEEGWLTYEESRARLTEKGRLFYDTVAEKVILPAEHGEKEKFKQLTVVVLRGLTEP